MNPGPRFLPMPPSDARSCPILWIPRTYFNPVYWLEGQILWIQHISPTPFRSFATTTMSHSFPNLSRRSGVILSKNHVLFRSHEDSSLTVYQSRMTLKNTLPQPYSVQIQYPSLLCDMRENPSQSGSVILADGSSCLGSSRNLVTILSVTTRRDEFGVDWGSNYGQATHDVQLRWKVA